MLLFNGYVGYADYIKNAAAPLVADLFLFCYEMGLYDASF